VTRWRWVPRDVAGSELEASVGFGTQEEAEAWMSSEWETLRADGAESASLLADGRVVYDMGLSST
jgi:hypothetical protein